MEIDLIDISMINIHYVAFWRLSVAKNLTEKASCVVVELCNEMDDAGYFWEFQEMENVSSLRCGRKSSNKWSALYQKRHMFLLPSLVSLKQGRPK